MTSRTLSRILCVEDEPKIQTIVKLALEKVGGFTVVLCTSGEEALEKAPAFDPDLILLDVLMPGMDGVATFEALKTLPGLSTVPVVFVTALAQADEIERYREMGIVDVITKPFDPMVLPDQLRAIWSVYLAASPP